MAQVQPQSTLSQFLMWLAPQASRWEELEITAKTQSWDEGVIDLLAPLQVPRLKVLRLEADIFTDISTTLLLIDRAIHLVELSLRNLHCRFGDTRLDELHTLVLERVELESPALLRHYPNLQQLYIDSVNMHSPETQVIQLDSLEHILLGLATIRQGDELMAWIRAPNAQCLEIGGPMINNTPNPHALSATATNWLSSLDFKVPEHPSIRVELGEVHLAISIDSSTASTPISVDLWHEKELERMVGVAAGVSDWLQKSPTSAATCLALDVMASEWALSDSFVEQIRRSPNLHRLEITGAQALEDEKLSSWIQSFGAQLVAASNLLFPDLCQVCIEHPDLSVSLHLARAGFSTPARKERLERWEITTESETQLQTVKVNELKEIIGEKVFLCEDPLL